MSFGGDDNKNTTTTTKYQMSPEQAALIKPTIPIAQQYLKNPPKLPTESGIADFNANQVAAQQSLLGQVLPQQQAAATAAGNANQFLLDPKLLYADSNPALQSYINAATRPITENLMEKVLPGIRGSAVSAGQYGGTRQGLAEVGSVREAARAVGDTSATIANQGYQTGLEAMTKGLALNPQTMASMTAPALLQAGVGDQQYAMAQAKLKEQQAKYMYQQMAPFLAAQEVAAMGAGIPGGTATATNSGGGSGPSVGGAVSGGLGGLSLAASLGATGPIGLGIGAGAGLLMSLFQ